MGQVKRKFYEKCFIVFLIFFIILSASYPAYASQNSYFNKKFVVFLLDASGSMKTNDPNRYAIDSIAQLIYTLPTNYEVGFVSYNAEVCAMQAFVDNSQRSRIMELAETVEYAGYSNAGAGLMEAVGMFSSGPDAQKDIILLSDGEILMEDEAATSQSNGTYQEAIAKAKENNITIHVIGLGEEMEDTGNSIFQAAEETGGGTYYSPQALEVQPAIDTITEDYFHIKQMTAAIVDAGGETENLNVRMPFAHASTVRVLLTSSSPIQNLKTNFNADDAIQTNGERYSLVEIKNPGKEGPDISFSGTAGSQVRITLIPEYQAVSKAEITYKDSVPENGEALKYDREATVAYSFYDSENESVRLWTEEYFDHSKLTVQEGESAETYTLEEGRIVLYKQVEEDVHMKTSFTCPEFPANVLNITPVEVQLEGPPVLPVEEPPKPPYELYALAIFSVLAIILIILVLHKKFKPKPVPVPESVFRPEPGKSSYIGKLNIYVTRTKSGYDISPLSYDLFRLPSNRVISIAEILENCGIRENFEGADFIYLSSGQSRSIILTNQSDCCIMKSGEILMKRKSYQLFTESKVDITFEDEISELTFQYKDLKPSEMY